VVIGNVFTEQPFHVSFIERDDKSFGERQALICVSLAF
jgi:hypothetical protein